MQTNYYLYAFAIASTTLYSSFLKRMLYYIYKIGRISSVLRLQVSTHFKDDITILRVNILNGIFLDILVFSKIINTTDRAAFYSTRPNDIRL